MTDSKIRLVIVDDEPLVRTALTMILQGDPAFEIVGQGADGQAGVDAVRALRPDVVLMDLHMPGRDGVWACGQIKRQFPQVSVLVLTAFDTDQMLSGALGAGAAGFLLKDSSAEQIIAAVHNVAGGQRSFSPAIVEQMVANQVAMGAGNMAPPQLTAREYEVAILVAEGLVNNEIADELGISLATVKTHVAHLLDKFGVRNRIQLAVEVHSAFPDLRGRG
ncbi:MAG: response regulator transcription factor [Actinomycetaceae bacterium]|nr:response regulator transcription factor [Actinomycetaceae bacterium]